MRIMKGIYYVLRIFVHVFYWSLRHEDVFVNGGIAPHILKLPGLYGYELKYLRPENCTEGLQFLVPTGWRPGAG